MLALIIASVLAAFAVETSDAWKTPVADDICDAVFYTEVQGVNEKELFEYSFYETDRKEMMMHCTLSLVPIHQE